MVVMSARSTEMRKQKGKTSKQNAFLHTENTETSKQNAKTNKQNAFLLAENTEMGKQNTKTSRQNAFLLAETTETSKQIALYGKFQSNNSWAASYLDEAVHGSYLFEFNSMTNLQLHLSIIRWSRRNI